MRTAEFVSPKHPDKLCDIISDTLLDKVLEKDRNARCNIQTMGGYGKVWITGEIASTNRLHDDDIKQIVSTISGVDDITINLINTPEQTENIANNQGIVIGYANRETSTMVPFEYELARRLNRYIYDIYPYDGKTQITVNGDDIVVIASFQNTNSEDLNQLTRTFIDSECESILHKKANIAKIVCNPLGTWTVGGLSNSSGISGGQIVIDNYGPRIPVGGGSFSGKDGSKIDRGAAYMARKIAIDAINKYELKYALVELSYSIGSKYPVQARIKGNNKGINVETGILLYEVDEVDNYDLSPNGIVQTLNLQRQEFRKTAEWGHFGTKFSWG